MANKPNESWASGFALNADYVPFLDCKPVFGVVSGYTHTSLKAALAEDPCGAKFYFHVYNKDRTALTKKRYNIITPSPSSVKLFDDYDSAAEHYNARIYECLEKLKNAEEMLLSRLLPEPAKATPEPTAENTGTQAERYDNIVVVPHEDAVRPKLGPDFERTVGMKQIETDHDLFWRTVIEKLGGTDTLRDFVPFSIKTLKAAYAEDKFFNTAKTPLRRWELACGWEEGWQGKMIRIGAPLQTFLLVKGIRQYSPSDCVCLLKQAAKQMMEEHSHKET